LTELFAEINTLLEGIERGAQKSSDIVKTLKMFSNDQNSEKPMLLDIHDNINSAVQLLHGKIKSNITIHKKYGEIKQVNGWPGKLNQALTNLLCNSLEAINDDKKGNLYISTYEANGYIKIRIEDDGEGVDETIKTQIFEPFFTTKKGYNGLGLSIVKVVINTHKGDVGLIKNMSNTTFEISLPISAQFP